MIRELAIVRAAAAHLAAAAERTTTVLLDGRVEHEPAFTDRMLGAIEEAMQGFEVRGVVWQAKTLTNQGRHAQEKRFGADFASVLSLDLPGFTVQKGFLAHAKLIDRGAPFRPEEYRRLQNQCDLMLQHTPASFVFLYSRDGIVVIPALSVLGAAPRNPHEFYSRRVSRFYEEHFESYIGDRGLSAPTTEALERLATERDARRVLYLKASSR